MQISVTQYHINHGTRSNLRYCPVALAMKTAGFTVRSVNNKTIQVVMARGQNTYFKTPTTVAQFINNFDLRRHVLPFHFQLTAESMAKKSPCAKGAQNALKKTWGRNGGRPKKACRIKSPQN